ncbi:MAG: hypothetical protein R3254_00990 [Thiomicrorhabdus sp.]|nr:hypothetical protein [Thiomicrorhabdus sp.]
MSTELLKYITPIALAAGIIGSYAVAQEKLKVLENDVEKLKEKTELQIRLDERQQVIQADVKNMDTKLDSIQQLIIQLGAQQ